MKRFEHGGTIFATARILGVDPSQILDFSASINPLGTPASVRNALRRHLNQIAHYPDTNATELVSALAAHHGIDASSILCGNGSAELIYLVVSALRPAHVLIPAPAFSEYERAAIASGQKCELSYFPLTEKGGFRLDADAFINAMASMVLTASSSPLAFLCNPNNPTGALTLREGVLKIARAARKLRCYLVVDEAFIDFCPEHSVMDAVRHNPYLIVLRSMTKFYALAGLRLGFGIFPSAVRKKMESLREPWSVNSLAQIAGLAAVADDSFRARSLRLIAREKLFLEKSFEALRIRFIPSSANFYLLKMLNAPAVADALARKGILVRSCANFRGLSSAHLRIAVRSRTETLRFIEELKICKA